MPIVLPPTVAALTEVTEAPLPAILVTVSVLVALSKVKSASPASAPLLLN